MTEINIKPDPQHLPIIPMYEMKPFDVGIIKSEGEHYNEVVMRSAGIRNTFEVFSLSDPRPDVCWTRDTINLQVQLVKATITVDIH